MTRKPLHSRYRSQIGEIRNQKVKEFSRDVHWTQGLVSPRWPVLLIAFLAVHRSRAVGLEGHLRLLAAVGADHIVHFPGPAVESPAAPISIHSFTYLPPVSQGMLKEGTGFLLLIKLQGTSQRD